jgi:hypothetical protein
VQVLQRAIQRSNFQEETIMNKLLTSLTMAAFCFGLVSLGQAEDKATKSPDNKKVEAKADLQAKIHRTMATLIEARTADEPDQAKIEKLTKKLDQLRAKQQSPTSAAGAAGWTCPRGGPGMGFGRGQGWGGQGRGPGWGGGRGQGWGRGGGFGPGWGGGPGGGAGRGFGPGGGMGRAPGGPAFVDRDNDGACDNYEVRHGMHNK